MNIYNLLSKVVLSTLEHLTPVARTLLGQPPQEEREPCNLNCFMEWKQEVPGRVNEHLLNLFKVMMATSRGQPGKGCVEARQYADLAFSLACRWIDTNWMKSKVRSPFF